MVKLEQNRGDKIETKQIEQTKKAVVEQTKMSRNSVIEAIIVAFGM